MRAVRTTLVALAVLVSLQAAGYAQQNLTIGLLDRSLEQLRQEFGIPGLSAVIVHERRVLWGRGFGMADVERSIDATADTPYLVGDLTQTLTATLLLERIYRGHLTLNERIERWTSVIPEKSATVGDVLRHTSTGVYRYDPDRFSAIAPIIELYWRPLSLRKVLAREILDRLLMQNSVPGREMEQPPDSEATLFDVDDLAQYRTVIQRLAVPYRVDVQRRATRNDYPTRTLTASAGLISSAADLARFDVALDDRLFFSEAVLAAMRERGGPTVPTGLGWFVQSYNNDKVVWHFSNIPNAYSSLIIKVPQRELTLILLANSDGLSAPFSLEQGDVTRSLFARAFLRTFLP